MWMPWGNTIMPPPKLFMSLPVLRSSLTTGSTVEPSHVFAPQRSYAQTLPSFGSMSTPAVEPHVRALGSSPQFLITVGFGFGNDFEAGSATSMLSEGYFDGC